MLIKDLELIYHPPVRRVIGRPESWQLCQRRPDPPTPGPSPPRPPPRPPRPPNNPDPPRPPCTPGRVCVRWEQQWDPLNQVLNTVCAQWRTVTCP